MTTGTSSQPVPLEDRAAASTGGQDGPLSNWTRRNEHPNSTIALETTGRASRSTRNSKSSERRTSGQTSTSRPTRAGDWSNQTKTRAYRPTKQKHHRTKKRRFKKPASHHQKTTAARKGFQARRWNSRVMQGFCYFCGKPIVYTNEYRCEDCWADDQQKWPGKDRSVTLNM